MECWGSSLKDFFEDEENELKRLGGLTRIDWGGGCVACFHDYYFWYLLSFYYELEMLCLVN